MHRKFGLIGYPLSHTFSPSYFKAKFEKEGIPHAEYDAYQLQDVSVIKELMLAEKMQGMNVTIPHKEKVIPFLDELTVEAQSIGAVNTISLIDGRLIGSNTDVYGFELSLKELLKSKRPKQALILGTGGASKAVAFTLAKMKINYKFVSRSAKKGLTYKELKGNLGKYGLIVNTTPLGMAPNHGDCPAIPYTEITSNHFCYDLIYNPEKTLFLRQAESRGASIMNGYKMLILQAERSWEIWNR